MKTKQAIEKSGRELSPLESLTTASLSRRDLLSKAGQGALSLGLLALLGGGQAFAAPRTRLERMLPGAREIGAHVLEAPGAGSLRLGALNIPTPTVNLPMWGDVIKFNQPQYYETITTGDIDGDGQDELLVRGPGGVLIQKFDAAAGQWIPLGPDGPPWGDSYSLGTTLWQFPQYYSTIRCADVNGDGKDEILARSKEGLIAYTYDTNVNSATYQQFVELTPVLSNWADANQWYLAEYYETIRFGNADGSGKKMAVGRNTFGVQTWQLNADNSAWTHLTDGSPDWSDNPASSSDGKTAWNLPQYYETIQFADVDGDGQEELLGRSASGLEVWKWVNNTWTYQATLTLFSDDNGWNVPDYYSTLRCADIDGDGAKEILSRYDEGVLVLKYDGATKTATRLIDGPPLSDDGGWNNPAYYSTIRYGDIDGDGAEEMIVKDGNGIETWKYFPNFLGLAGPMWVQLAGNNPTGQPAWNDAGDTADANGAKWNQVEYYSTIQFAHVFPDRRTGPVFLNPNNQPTHDSQNNPRFGPYAALIGRDKYGVQTWRYQQKDNNYRENGGAWSRASAPFPDFTSANADPDYVAGYNYLTAYWGLAAGTGPIRWHYNDAEQSNFATWYNIFYKLQPGNSHQTPLTPDLAQPATVKDPAKWTALCWQLYWELRHAQKVQEWYGTHVHNLLADKATQDNATLTAVGGDLSLPASGGNTFALNLLEIVANGAWAVLGISEFDSNLSSSVGGIIATAAAAALDVETDGGQSFQGTYENLLKTVNDIHINEMTANGQIQLAVLGGSKKDTNNNYYYIPGDVGLLTAMGDAIESGAWSWPVDQNGNDDNTQFKQAGQSLQAIAYWQALLPASGWLLAQDVQFRPRPRLPL